MKAEKVFTKRKMRVTSVFLTDADHRVWLAAASMAGISRAELLRRALREKSNAILNAPMADQRVRGTI